MHIVESGAESTSATLALRDQCSEAGVAFFFKQWGGVNKAKAGRLLDGHTHDAMPEVRGA